MSAWVIRGDAESICLRAYSREYERGFYTPLSPWAARKMLSRIEHIDPEAVLVLTNSAEDWRDDFTDAGAEFA